MKYGSTKQIEWAERIKAELTWDNVKSHPIVEKAKELILSIDNAEWWIDHRDDTGYQMIYSMLTGGYYISFSSIFFTNRGNAKKAKILPDGSAIEITWTEIVPDDRGGHKVDRTETITA